MITLFFSVVLHAHVLTVTSGKFFMYGTQCEFHGQNISETITRRYPRARVRWECRPRNTVDA